MTKCQPKAFVVYKGYPTRWNDVDWLSIKFSSETGMDFTNFSAQFKIGDYTFTNNNLLEDWIINLTNEQTGTLPLGINTASLIVYDTLGEGKPFITNIPVLVKDWVDGEVEVDTYKATIFATLDNKNEFIVNVETAKVNLDWVEGKISEHNQSESAHQYIQESVNNNTNSIGNLESLTTRAKTNLVDAVNEINATSPNIIPEQSGNEGKFISTNGTELLWSEIDLSGYATVSWVDEQGFLKNSGTFYWGE